MARKIKPEQGDFHFKLELIRMNRKTGCIFALVHKQKGFIERIIRPNANAFWVNAGRQDLYAVNFDNEQFTTIYKFFPYGRSGRWELTELTTPSFKEHRDNRYVGKYRGPRMGPKRFRKKVPSPGVVSTGTMPTEA